MIFALAFRIRNENGMRWCMANVVGTVRSDWNVATIEQNMENCVCLSRGTVKLASSDLCLAFDVCIRNSCGCGCFSEHNWRHSIFERRMHTKYTLSIRFHFGSCKPFHGHVEDIDNNRATQPHWFGIRHLLLSPNRSDVSIYKAKTLNRAQIKYVNSSVDEYGS